MIKPWHATLLTLFPEMFPGPLGHSIAGKALEKKQWKIDTINIRDFAKDRHHTVDDTPYGGGTGLVMIADIVHEALKTSENLYPDPEDKPQYIYMTPRGKPLTHTLARQLSTNKTGVVILCGRYEGVDDRVIEHWREEKGLIEISIGDYVLSGGEMAALVLLDACVRLLPGVLIKEDATTSESFETNLLEFSQYTKPRVWNNKTVPEILLSGDHGKIEKWRQNCAKEITKNRRPDLWEKYINSTEKNS
ncbi:MAG: tRNA (guanosine(37)-N1)-methyltransferase TrmD [Candidatus Paracaedibacteraceae bacterium]|nr:tRNA (guanosine(37)-N1)-methyltransferase TrmD [Candidatus Paracaedibacteraceae bacterium]